MTTTRTTDPFAATFSLAGSDVGLRAHVLPTAPMQVFMARSPSVRRARSEDAKLERYWMPTLMLRRRGEDLASRFVAVLEPTRAQGFIRSIRWIDAGPSLAIEVVRTGGRDLVVINPDHRSRCTVDVAGRPLEVHGRVGVVSAVNEQCCWAYLLDGTSLRFGKTTLKSPGRWTGSLIKAGADEPSRLVTDAKLPVGQSLARGIALVTHGNGRSHGYVIRRIDRHDRGATITIEGDCGFDYDAQAGVTRFRCFPRWKIKGLARVAVIDRALWTEPTSQ